MAIYYRHYKGNVYRFLYEAKHSETGDELVVYQALYGNRGIWARPKDMFYGCIEIDGYKQFRFTEISREEAFVRR